MTSATPACKLDFYVNDEWSAVLPFMARMRGVLQAPAQAGGRVDLTQCGYIGPFAVSVIGARIKTCEVVSRKLELMLPNTPPALVNYCRYSGLKQWAGLGPPPDHNHPDNETVPLTQFSEVLWGTASTVISLISRHIELSADDQDALQLCFTEMGQNIADHAKSIIGGVFAARYMSQQRCVRVAIVDRGHGILATLSRAHPRITTSRQAIEAVLAGGMSAGTFARNRGLGVSHLKDTVMRLGGEVSIFSGDAAVHVGSGRVHWWSEGETYYPGTAIFFILHVGGNA